MGKKAVLFIIVGIVLGAGLAAGGVFFMLKNGGIQAPVEPVVEVFDTTQGYTLSLKDVLIPLVQTSSRPDYLKADFTVIFKTEEALAKAEGIAPHISEAIYSVFETKTANELKVHYDSNGAKIVPRETMKEEVLNAIRNVFLEEEDKENVAAIIIYPFNIGN